MKKILNRLTQHETLTEKESRNIIIDISEGKLNTSEISSFLTMTLPTEGFSPVRPFLAFAKFIASFI